MQAKQALQTRSREHALAHIGIPSSFGAFINQGIADLAEDWVHTYQTVLTEQQRQVHGHCRLVLARLPDRIDAQ